MRALPSQALLHAHHLTADPAVRFVVELVVIELVIVIVIGFVGVLRRQLGRRRRWLELVTGLVPEPHGAGRDTDAAGAGARASTRMVAYVVPSLLL